MPREVIRAGFRFILYFVRIQCLGEGGRRREFGDRSVASGNLLAHRNYLKSGTEYFGENIPMTDLYL
jgi:hypothetical protein